MADHDITTMIWLAASAVGRNAPKIADHLLAHDFPQSRAATEEEGAGVFLRRGLIEHVQRILKSANDDTEQADLSEIDPSFRSLARECKSKSYYVESLAEQVPLARLIAEPRLLDEARTFMRRKGQECLDEAVRLDRLYAAIMDRAA